MGGGGGYSGFQVTGMIEGFFWQLDLSRDFFGHSKLVFLFFVLYQFCKFWKFLVWLGNSAGDLLGVKFWSRDFLGLRFLPPFDHPCHLKSGVPPPGSSYAEKLY